MFRSGSCRVAAAITLGTLAVVAAAERPGNLWKTTSQMQMDGVPMPPMPAQTAELCTAKDWTQPSPPPAGQTCSQTNVQQDGNTIRWQVSCSGEMDMSGEGEITFDTPDSCTGWIKFLAEGMSMTVNLSGTKVGECDDPVG